ncbi:MAG TPA: helix-turn-helix domain-containing protein [Candidatus Ventrimonas merdavium]|nr:helix-turn-helix domain-containing protein [Candidatus Ventrimonas merdavium]
MMQNYTEIVTMIMQKQPLQTVIDAAAELLGAAIIFLNSRFDMLAYSTTVPVRDPYWQRALREGRYGQDILSKVFDSDYVKSLPPSIMTGVSYPPDNITLKYWVQFPPEKQDDIAASVSAIAIPEDNTVSKQKQDIFQSLAWLIKITYLDAMASSGSILCHPDRAALLHALEYEISTGIADREALFQNVQLLVFRPTYQQKGTIWLALINYLDEILKNTTATIYKESIVALTERLTKEQKNALSSLAERFNGYLGISWFFSGKNAVREHYLQAVFSIDAAAALNKKERLLEYDDYYIYAILSCCRKKDTWASCEFPALGVLRQYDAKHKTNLYTTFACYLRNGMHITMTADALGIHKSTLQHRLDNIRELLCDMDIVQPDLQTALLMAYAIEDINAISSDWEQFPSLRSLSIRP